MEIDLDFYKAQFALQNAEFTRIDHADTIIAEVYQIVTSDKECFILKVCPREEDYLREVYFLQQLKICLPIPQILKTVAPSGSHFGAILMQYVEGHLLNNADWSPDLAFEIGMVLARLHNRRTEGYGDLIKPKSLTPNAVPYFNDKFLEELEECRNHLPEEMIQKCGSYLLVHQNLLESVDGPCLVHRDFRPGNLLVNKGKLQAIIDWSSGRFGFAEQDFCSLEQWTIDSKNREALLKGYASLRSVPNYQKILPLLQLGRSLAVIGYTIKSHTWNNTNEKLYQLHRKLLNNLFK